MNACRLRHRGEREREPRAREQQGPCGWPLGMGRITEVVEEVVAAAAGPMDCHVNEGIVTNTQDNRGTRFKNSNII